MVARALHPTGWQGNVDLTRMFRVALWLATFAVPVCAPATGRLRSQTSLGAFLDTSITAAKVTEPSPVVPTEIFTARSPKRWLPTKSDRHYAPSDGSGVSAHSAVLLRSSELGVEPTAMPALLSSRNLAQKTAEPNISETVLVASSERLNRQSGSLQGFSSRHAGDSLHTDESVFGDIISPSPSLALSSSSVMKSLRQKRETRGNAIGLATSSVSSEVDSFMDRSARGSDAHTSPSFLSASSEGIYQSSNPLVPSEVPRTHSFIPSTAGVSETPPMPSRSPAAPRNSETLDSASTGATMDRRDTEHLQASVTSQQETGAYTTRSATPTTAAVPPPTVRMSTINTLIPTPPLPTPRPSNHSTAYFTEPSPSTDTMSLGLTAGHATRSMPTHTKQSVSNVLKPTASTRIMPSVVTRPSTGETRGNRRHGLSGYPRSKLTVDKGPDSINILMPILVFIALAAVVGKLLHRCCTHSENVELQRGSRSGPDPPRSSRPGNEGVHTVAGASESTADIMKEMRYIYRRHNLPHHQHCHCCCNNDLAHSSQNPLLRAQSREQPLALYLGENVDDEGADDAEAQVTRL